MMFFMCRFIGELFKLSMLTERIMHDCIMNLLKATDEESLECLCRLVSTVGKSLDHDKAKVKYIFNLQLLYFNFFSICFSYCNKQKLRILIYWLYIIILL